MPFARSAATAGRALVCTVLITGCGAIRVAPAPVVVANNADTVGAAPRGQRFYTGKTVGSEAAFNPVSVLVNESFDLLRTAGGNRQIFELDYELAARGAWRATPSAPLTWRCGT